MAQHNDTGNAGEKLAAAWLTKNGFTVREVNWRYSHLEVDIIASKGDTLHFIEVKTRSSNRYGNPEESITRKKFQNLKDAAERYQMVNSGWKWIMFDVLAILFKPNEIEYWFNQDVYF